MRIVFLKLMRPAQWVKNLFVFSTLFFSKSLGDAGKVAATVAAFSVFCLLSSAIYLLNDVLDVEEDRVHPTKKKRPIAAGQVAVSTALITSIVLAVIGIGAAVCLGWRFATVAGLFLALSVAYCLGGKRLVILDVLMIAAGFALRVIGGSAAILIAPSHWLIICTVLLALFLGFTKRRAELALLDEAAPDHRQVLAHYDVAFLDQMISIVTGATLLCYILYTVDARTVGEFGSRGLLLSVPFVMYGLFRYLYLIYRKKAGDDPTQTVFTDVPMLINLVLWGACCLCIVYFRDQVAALFG
ncbi:MAG: decaprenyl-phosphate phosphoribosyltransferase [Planctomycetes bacterium]|nr:decaprenyl-phosphate phosphoribosyltransferase [Planctomycetota bacterium]